jgi:hypothetical protein
VSYWVNFYKAHRQILISDIIHVKRADMVGLDGFMHANALLPERGLAMVFNPTLSAISQNWTLPLYYTGISTTALVSEQGAPAVAYTLARDYTISVPVTVGPRNLTWLVITSGDS